MVIIMNNLSEMIDTVLNAVIGQNHASEIVQFKKRTLHSPHLFQFLSRNPTDSGRLINDSGEPYFSTLLET